MPRSSRDWHDDALPQDRVVRAPEIGVAAQPLGDVVTKHVVAGLLILQRLEFRQVKSGHVLFLKFFENAIVQLRDSVFLAFFRCAKPFESLLRVRLQKRQRFLELRAVGQDLAEDAGPLARTELGLLRQQEFFALLEVLLDFINRGEVGERVEIVRLAATSFSRSGFFRAAISLLPGGATSAIKSSSLRGGRVTIARFLPGRARSISSPTLANLERSTPTTNAGTTGPR